MVTSIEEGPSTMQLEAATAHDPMSDTVLRAAGPEDEDLEDEEWDELEDEDDLDVDEVDDEEIEDWGDDEEDDG
jgi:hypothetical protein